MGQCQMRNCRCFCNSNRIACQCGSQNTLILEDQVRELKRRNRESTMKRSNRFSNVSPKKSNSRDSSDSQNKTKHSTNRKSHNSPQQDYLLSDYCNLTSEPNQPKPKAIQVRVMAFRFRGNYEEAMNIEADAKESPNFLGRRGTLEQMPSGKERPTLQTAPELADKKSSSLLQPSESYKQSVSIQAQTEKYSKLSKPVTSASVDAQPASDQKIKEPQVVSQNGQQMRSKTAEILDDQRSVMTPGRSVLKQTQKTHDSFRTQQQDKNRKVRFDLPHSHYIKEKIKQQQKFFK